MGKPLGPDNVTAKQRAAYEMRKSGSTWDEIGIALGMSGQSARSAVAGAERHGLPPLPKRQYRYRDVVPHLATGRVPNPDAAAPATDDRHALIGPEGKFELKFFLASAAAAGIPPKAAMAMGTRIAANHGQVEVEFKKLTLAEQIDEIEQKRNFLASKIDEVSVMGMNAKDLAFAWKALLEGEQLLRGKPTTIIDFNVRQKLEVLMPQFLAEARRRGITIEGEFKHDAAD